MRGTDHHAHREPDVGADRPDLRRSLDGRAQAESEHLGVATDERAAHRDEQAAAAQPADQPVGARDRQPPGDLQDERLTDLLPQGVVHLPEGVDADEGRHHRPPARQQRVQPAGRLGQVRQPGEAVDRRRALQVGEQATALERDGELRTDRLEQAQVADVEACARRRAVRWP